MLPFFMILPKTALPYSLPPLNAKSFYVAGSVKASWRHLRHFVNKLIPQIIALRPDIFALVTLVLDIVRCIAFRLIEFGLRAFSLAVSMNQHKWSLFGRVVVKPDLIPL